MKGETGTNDKGAIMGKLTEDLNGVKKKTSIPSREERGPLYDKKKSFYVPMSRFSKERDGIMNWGKERQVNLETFGVPYVPRTYQVRNWNTRDFRGRGRYGYHVFRRKGQYSYNGISNDSYSQQNSSDRHNQTYKDRQNHNYRNRQNQGFNDKQNYDRSNYNDHQPSGGQGSRQYVPRWGIAGRKGELFSDDQFIYRNQSTKSENRNVPREPNLSRANVKAFRMNSGTIDTAYNARQACRGFNCLITCQFL